MTSSASPPFGLYMLDVLIEGTDIAATGYALDSGSPYR